MPGKKKKKVSSDKMDMEKLEELYQKTLKFDQTIVTTEMPKSFFTEEMYSPMTAENKPVKKKATRRKTSTKWPSISDRVQDGEVPAPPPMPVPGDRYQNRVPVNRAGRCPEPDCRQCASQRRKEMEQLPKYYTGLRVSVAGLGPRRKIGTVINLPGLPKGKLAVCLDSPVGPDAAHTALNEFTKPGFGVLAREGNVRVLEDQNTYAAFENMPPHIGVVVAEGDRVDSVTFKNGQTGRLLSQPHGPTEAVLVSWSFPNRHFFEGSGHSGDIPRGEHSSCYNVPRSMLAFCRLDNRGRPATIWPNSGKLEDVDFNKGDYLRVVVAEPQRVTNGIRNYRLSAGTIVKYQGAVDRYKSNVTLAGGCDPAIIGIQAIVATRGLEKLEDDFIDAGEEVEIRATLDFRKQDLKGLRAVVILPLDQDGEVGLQFKEDIGAGSLDGHGEDKRCLYIHHSLVKKASG